MMLLLLLSGPVAVGKSGVANALVKDHGFASIKSSAYLRAKAKAYGLAESRAVLQATGDRLDDETDFKWLIDDVAVPAISASPNNGRWLLDSVRKQRQVEHFRDHFETSVLHVHLTASEPTIETRYGNRLIAGNEAGNVTYAVSIAHTNEISARSLIDIADFRVDLTSVSSEAAASTIVEKWKEREVHAPNCFD
jgi:adenylosuccinate synthase